MDTLERVQKVFNQNRDILLENLHGNVDIDSINATAFVLSKHQIKELQTIADKKKFYSDMDTELHRKFGRYNSKSLSYKK